MYSVKKKTKKRAGKKWIVVIIVAIIIIGGGISWRIWIYKPASQVITTAGNLPKGTPSDNSGDSPEPPKRLNTNTSRTIGGGTDTNGQSNAPTSPSQWITSKSGAITVEQPIANATIQSGSVLSGTAKVSAVNFRLTDNSVGVISEGTLNVVNGKFSGKLNFTAHSSTGRLDVFSTGNNGVELNEIQIAVRF